MLETRHPNIVMTRSEMPDLAPMIVRERLVIEGRHHTTIEAEDIAEYLRQLSVVCDMRVLLDPVTHRSDLYGWAGWIHWETSGAHFYAWESPIQFFSVDIYTCKHFDAAEAVEFTSAFFNTTTVVARSF